MAQIQCCNCGGYKTSWVSSRYFELKTGREGTPRGNWPWAAYTLWFLGALVVAIPVTVGLAQGDPSSFGGLLVLALWSAPFLAIAYWNETKPRKEMLREECGYSCDICGYTWTSGQGEPAANITVRPDLIAKGNQLLEEEEERNSLLD
ncbi:MAG: hypothetical protein Q8Q00_01930 [Dehalococcoidia bacterium]|nr:hypothetical protein [Dehalococcoidia bacterium]